MIRKSVWGLAWVAVLSVIPCVPAGQARGADVVAAGTKTQGELETKLLGHWRGGPCMGLLTFRADGTFEREHYSPGDRRLSGTWRLDWNALPPTLSLECTASDDEQFVGKSDRRKLLVLSEKHLGLMYVDPKSDWPEVDAEEFTKGLVLYERKRGEEK